MPIPTCWPRSPCASPWQGPTAIRRRSSACRPSPHRRPTADACSPRGATRASVCRPPGWGPTRWSASRYRSSTRGDSAAEQPPGQVPRDLTEPDPLLRHRVALADGYGLVLQRLEVHGDAERRADLVLAAVAPADRAGVVELHVPGLAQLGRQVARHRRQVLVPGQRQHRCLDRGQPAAGSITYGTQRSFLVWSKYDRSTPECSVSVLRSKSVRFAMPSISPQSPPAKPKRYSMSTVRVE